MTEPYLRSALFVDFDNIYSGLERGSREAARRFAQDPARWIGWLERLPVAGDEGLRRRLLVRRCYLNPRRYNAFRPYFIRSAFEVVDCPPLTQQGKTSADVMMVLDVVDALNHPTRFDEFIVFSGDADFTPVLLRLRKHDRRTAVLTVGPASGAYRAASDLLLPEETFIEEALGVSEAVDAPAATAPGGNGHAQRAPRTLLEDIAHRLHEAAGLTGALEPWNLPALYKEFPEFTRGEDWLGYYSLRALTEAVVATHEGLVVREEEDWRVEVRGDAEEGAALPAAADVHEGEGNGAGPLHGAGASPAGDPRPGVARFVRERMAAAEQPVVLATLAQEVLDRFGEGVRTGRWRGAGSFKAFLESMDLGDLRISAVGPGHVYHPERHGEVGPRDERDLFAEEHPDLAELARSIHDVTDTPYLSPRQYAVVLEEIARQVNEDDLVITRTSKAVRDRTHGKGISVARADVGFLLKGLTFSGYELRPGEETALSIGRQVARNTVQLARRAQMDLDDEDEERVEAWILGGLETKPALPARNRGAGERDGTDRSLEPHHDN